MFRVISEKEYNQLQALKRSYELTLDIIKDQDIYALSLINKLNEASMTISELTAREHSNLTLLNSLSEQVFFLTRENLKYRSDRNLDKGTVANI